MNSAAIILAAGGSSRMGSPKQLLSLNGQSFTQHIVTAVREAGCRPIILVTGAAAEEVSAAVDLNEVVIVNNQQWQTGMASSIVAGIRHLLSLSIEFDSLLLAVCDQPFVSSTLIKSMLEKKLQSGKKIVACSYADTIGTPVLFDKTFLPELLALQGDGGAKKLVSLYANETATVTFPQGALDIDTKEDYQKLVNNEAPTVAKQHD